MIRRLVLACLPVAIWSSSASAKEVALILDDQERAALVQVLDAATRAEGLRIAPLTVGLLNKLNVAPDVVAHKPEKKAPAKPAPAKPAPAKPAEEPGAAP